MCNAYLLPAKAITPFENVIRLHAGLGQNTYTI